MCIGSKQFYFTMRASIGLHTVVNNDFYDRNT